MRYLAGSHALRNWCDFGSLQPANPTLSGCSKCLTHDADTTEVKFISAIWICFSFDPTQVQPQHKTKLHGWISTTHWNGNVFRTGEYNETLEQLTGDQRQQREEELECEEQAELAEEFGDMVCEVESICKPRMIQHRLDVIDKQLKILQKSGIGSPDSAEM